MPEPVGDPDTSDRNAGGDTTARHHESIKNLDAAPMLAQDQSPSKKSAFDIVTKLIEIAVGIFVGGSLICVGYLQYTVYSRQARIMETQTKILAAANDLNVAIQRPFVGVSSVDVVNLGEIPASVSPIPTPMNIPAQPVFSIVTTWENTGNSEARELSIGRSETYGGTQTPEFPEGIGNINYVLLPKAKIHIPGGWTSEGGFKAAKANVTENYMFGLAIYKDLSGAQHFTMSCYEIAVPFYGNVTARPYKSLPRIQLRRQRMRQIH